MFFESFRYRRDVDHGDAGTSSDKPAEMSTHSYHAGTKFAVGIEASSPCRSPIGVWLDGSEADDVSKLSAGFSGCPAILGTGPPIMNVHVSTSVPHPA